VDLHPQQDESYQLLSVGGARASLDAVRASLRWRSPNGLSEPSDAVLLMKIEPHQRHGYFLVPRRQPSESEYARTFDDPMDAFDFEGSAHSHTARSD